MINRVLRHLSFRLRAQSLFQIHSPFFYELISKVLMDKQQYPEYKDYDLVKKELSRDNTKIYLTDYGARSTKKISIKKAKTVREILQQSSSKRKWSFLLYRIARSNKPKSILELGTSLGLTTMLLAKALPEINVTTIEGCSNLAELAKTNFKNQQLNNIKILNAPIDKILDDTVKNESPELIFFDGNHRKEATITYFEKCLPYITGESIFVFVDIYWSKEMTEAWEYIKQHPKTIATLDLFQFGIVFFKKELSRQHFKYSI